MPRYKFETLNQVHELTFSVNQRVPLFVDQQCGSIFLQVLDAARNSLGFKLHAYVVMPEHVHLLVHLQQNVTVSQFLQRVKQPSATRILRTLRDKQDPILQRLKSNYSQGPVPLRLWLPGGGYDRCVTKPETMHQMVDYIHDNPVRRGLVASPELYALSSASIYAGVGDGPIAVDFPAV